MTRRPTPRLGDLLAIALAKAGITRERIERWLGKPCKCKDRQEKLNQLGNWARGFLTGRGGQPSHLDGIMEDASDLHGQG